MIPFVSTFSVFASARACEFLRTDICYQQLNVKVIATHGGISFGSGGATHHGTEDYSVVRAFPHLTVIVPADAIETAKAVKACMDINGPVYIRIGRGFEPNINKSEDYDFEIGKAIEMRSGTDLTIIATGATVFHAVQAADILKQDGGISARVLNMHTLKPLDEEAVLKAVVDTRRIITVEDHNVINRRYSGCRRNCCQWERVRFTKLGIPDTFCPHGYPEDLMHMHHIDTDGIVENVRELLNREFEEDEDWEDEV